MWEVYLGIISSIITTWILFIGKNFWETKITPYIQETRYQGVIIDGAWTAFEKNETTETDCRVFLIQSAHHLTGTATFKYVDITNPNNSYTLDFNITGYMWEGYITLNFRPKDRKVTSYATALLKLHNGGITLIGHWCIRNVQSEQVEAHAIFLNRTKSS